MPIWTAWRMLLLPILIGWLLAGSRVSRGDEGVDFFESRVRPVLAEHCYPCHASTADDIQAGLALDSRQGILEGGEAGPVVVPGQPAASRLVAALRYEDAKLQMPPDGKLGESVLADVERWIAQGAPLPSDETAVLGFHKADRARRHWAFRTPATSAASERDSAESWASEIDAFVVDRLQQAGLQPALQAEPAVLVRRLFHDLWGLPPTYEQVMSFAARPTAEAYEQLVDQLLASEHFGERWARHWLDLARFADTKGYVFQEDRNFPQAYKYRDWVIRALNEDLPFDQFLIYQLAADRVVDGTIPEQRRHLAAMGFLTLGRRFINNSHDIIDDRIDVVFRGLMGLTLTCARCHDHKYDPISASDYYGVYGIFASSRDQQEEDLPLYLVDSDSPREVGVFARGNPSHQGPPVPRAFPEFFRHSAQVYDFTAGSGRLALARAIASRDNPLTARVFVNRVWGHLFGTYLVETPSDWGLRSDPPLHPELLDALAVHFMEDGWSVKRVIRSIVLSRVYRQRSDITEASLAGDPENRLYGRVPRQRLDFESMRDALLAVSGQLDRTVGGPSVPLDSSATLSRRTLYAFIDRQNLPGVFRVFDFASPDTHAPRRPQTMVPQQALYLLNSPFALQAAIRLAQRTEGATPLEARIGELYRLVLAREPSAAEVALGQQFLDSDPDDSFQWPVAIQFGDHRSVDATVTGRSDAELRGPWPEPLDRWALYAQALLLSNEFLFVD